MNNIKKYQNGDSRRYDIPGLGLVPSVTSVLSQVKKIPGAYFSRLAVNYLRENLLDKLVSGEISLKQFKEMDLNELMKYAKATAKRDYEKAGDIGTRVHAAIEAYFKNEVIVIDKETDKPYNAFIEWVNKNNVICLLSEHTVYSKVGYAGTLDFIGMINGKKYLVDFKSSKGF
jgi:hypothetical protein